MALVFWAISALLRETQRFSLSAPVLIFLFITTLSTVVSVEPMLSWGRMRTVSLLMLMPLAATCLRTAGRLRWIAGALIVSCVLSAGYTGWQYLWGVGVQIGAPANSPAAKAGFVDRDVIDRINDLPIHSPGQWFGALRGLPSGSMVRLRVQRGSPPDPMEKRLSFRDLEISGLTVPGSGISLARPFRAQGNFQHYFPYSEVLVEVGLLAFALALTALRARRLRLAVVLAGAFLAIAMALEATLTRISMVSLLIGCGLILLLLSKPTMRWVILPVVLVVAGTVTLYFTARRGEAHIWQDSGTQYRLLMWKGSWSIIQQHPLLGVGLDAVAGHWQRWDLDAYRRFPLRSHFHSTPIQLTVETGLLGLIAWIWLIGAMARSLWKTVGGFAPPGVRPVDDASTRDWFSQGVLLGALAGLVAFLIIGLLQYNFGDAEFMVVFWLVCGLALATVDRGKDIALCSSIPSGLLPTN